MAGTRLGRWTGRAVLAGCGLAIAAAGSAFAAASVLGNDETLYACAQQPSGLLRLVDDVTQCRSTESAVQWSVQGPPGVQGIQGPQGEQGTQGVQGPAGPSDAYSVSAGNEVPIPIGPPTPLLTLEDLPAGKYVAFSTITAHNLGSGDTLPINCHLASPFGSSRVYSARIDPFVWRGVGFASGASTATIALTLTTDMSDPGSITLRCQSNHISPAAVGLAGGRQITAIKVANLVP